MKPKSGGACKKHPLCKKSWDSFKPSLSVQSSQCSSLKCDWWSTESCGPTCQEKNYTVIKLGPRVTPYSSNSTLSWVKIVQQIKCTMFRKMVWGAHPGRLKSLSYVKSTLQNTSLVWMSNFDVLGNLVGQLLWPTLAANIIMQMLKELDIMFHQIWPCTVHNTILSI